MTKIEMGMTVTIARAVGGGSGRIVQISPSGHFYGVENEVGGVSYFHESDVTPDDEDEDDE